MALLSAMFVSAYAHAEIKTATQPIMVFAAASTKPVVDALIPQWKRQGLTVRAVYAASSTLARQIIQGAPADIYISANVGWMKAVADKGLLEAGTRTIVATNALVLITSSNSTSPQSVLGRGYPLKDLLGGGRLAIANPDHVPAGIYGRESLKNLGLWNQVKDHLAPAANVTGALMLVARGEVKLGLVYASDARRGANVKVFATVPNSSHSPIAYPAAILKGHASAPTRAAFAMLSGAAGQAAFMKAGFKKAP